MEKKSEKKENTNKATEVKTFSVPMAASELNVKPDVKVNSPSQYSKKTTN